MTIAPRSVPEPCSARLLYARPSADDVPELVPVLSDPEVMQHVGSGRPLPPEDVPLAVGLASEQWRRFGYGMFTLRTRVERRIVGRAGLTAWDVKRWRTAVTPNPDVIPQIGIMLAHSEWGVGLGREAVGAVLTWGRECQRLGEILYVTRSANQQAIRVALAAGLVDVTSQYGQSSGRVFTTTAMSDSA